MPRNVYSEINLHIVWRTKRDTPVMMGTVVERLYHYIEHRVIETDGVFLHALGGIEDHVHLAISVPPTLLISDWIGKLKGAAAHYINHEIANRKVLEWQSGYGVISFGTKDLEWVIRYIKDQKEHHKRGTTHERLEKVEG